MAARSLPSPGRKLEGVIVIADITGYTVYLSESELEHAQGVLSSLLELLIAHTQPPFVLSRLAGDAVISYGVAERAPRGQTFVERLEQTYVAFRKALDLMVLNNTCQCTACSNVKHLDLKFFVHRGEFMVQKLSAQEELVGNDVNLVHRLLKNHVTEQTGFHAYTLYTDSAVRDLELESIGAQWVAHREEYDHLGSVSVRIQDMHEVWDRRRDESPPLLPDDEVFFRVSGEIAAPRPVVWEYLTKPEHRRILIGSDRQELVAGSDGRVGEGSVFRCYHGDQLIPQTVVEWRPFVRLVTEDLVPVPVSGTTLLLDYRLEPTPTGTRVTQAVGRPRGPRLGRWIASLAARTMRKGFQRDMDAFVRHVEAALESQGGLDASARPARSEVEAAATTALDQSRSN